MSQADRHLKMLLVHSLEALDKIWVILPVIVVTIIQTIKHPAFKSFLYRKIKCSFSWLLCLPNTGEAELCGVGSRDHLHGQRINLHVIQNLILHTA